MRPPCILIHTNQTLTLKFTTPTPMFFTFPLQINGLATEMAPMQLFLHNDGGYIFYKFLISLSFLA